MDLDLRTLDVVVRAKWRDVGDEVIAAPQPTGVDVLTDEDSRDSLRSHGGNLGVRLRHKVNEGPEWDVLSRKVANLMPPVVGRITVDDGDVRGEAVVLAGRTPERIWFDPRLYDPTPTTFFSLPDAIFGNAVGLRHTYGGRGHSPT